MIQTFSKAEGAHLSGSMAYYTFLSLLPLLMVAGFVLGTISHGNAAFQEAIATGVGASSAASAGENYWSR